MESLLNQTYPEREIIVIDDGSTDGSQKILGKYAGMRGVRVLLSDRNEGLAHVCNMGLERASGEYVMFAECDDFSDPNQISELMKGFHQSGDVGVVFSASNIVDASGSVIADDCGRGSTSFKKQGVSAIIPRGLMRQELLRSCVIPNMSAALIRKKDIFTAGSFDAKFKACVDWDFWCRMSSVCDFYFIGRPYNNFRRHPATVRNLIGIKTQLTEIHEILISAARLSGLRGCGFFLFLSNLGYVFAKETVFSRSLSPSILFSLHRSCGFLFVLLYCGGLIRAFCDYFFYLSVQACRKRIKKVMADAV